MATYLELYDLQNKDQLLHRIAVATAVAADGIRTEDPATTNHANRLVWAKQAFTNPVALVGQILWAVLAANKDASEANILAADDNAIQSNVDAVVDILAGA